MKTHQRETHVRIMSSVTPCLYFTGQDTTVMNTPPSVDEVTDPRACE